MTNQQIIFFDDFNKGLSKWINFGSPKPYTKNGYYIPNGDNWYPSGSYTKEKFKIEDDLILEFKAFQKPGYAWDMLYGIGFGNDVKYREDYVPTTATIGIYGHFPDSNPNLEMAITCNINGKPVRIYRGLNDGKEHIYHIVFKNGKIAFYMDNRLLYECQNEFIGKEAPLIIYGRTYNKGSNGVDYIKLYKITQTTTEIPHTTTKTIPKTKTILKTKTIPTTIEITPTTTKTTQTTTEINPNRIIIGTIIGLAGIALLKKLKR